MRPHQARHLAIPDVRHVMAFTVTRIFTATLEFVRTGAASGPSKARKMEGLRSPEDGPSLARGKLLGFDSWGTMNGGRPA